MTKAASRTFADPTLPRTLPFALFMTFIALGEAMQFMGNLGWISIPDTALYYLYPLKTLCVAALLVLYSQTYREIDWRELANLKTTAVTCGVGVLTCVIWVWLDWSYSITGTPPRFDPTLLPAGAVRFIMTLFRVAGAVLVVPLMEELFWRSFLIRYLVDTEFDTVPVGRFTWPSFLITTVLFGLEHHLFVAGIAAGAIYNLLLYKTRSVTHCVAAHAVTNLSLALYVLATGKWYFW